MISAKIIADSKNKQGDRITTFILTFPRFILAELNTHRVFSKNSASSRAIPFAKMVEMVEKDPFIPIAWQKSHKGMQGTEYLNYEQDNEVLKRRWLLSRDNAVKVSKLLNESNVTKQLCNRLLEPFMWHTVILTGTEFENFFNLRCPQYVSLDNTVYKSWKDLLKDKETTAPKDWLDSAKSYTFVERLTNNKGQSEIHMMALAEAMYDAYNESTPKHLNPNEWHIPYQDKIDENLKLQNKEVYFGNPIENILKIGVSYCARVSYTVVGEEGISSYENDIKLFDKLKESGHFSPFEHCARAMDNREYNTYFNGIADDYSSTTTHESLMLTHKNKGKGWCRNFKGFVQLRCEVD